MDIKCIMFDLDDTLWDCAPVIERAEKATYAWLSSHYPRITDRYSFPELIQHRINFVGKYPELHYNLSTLRKSWLANLADQVGYSRSLADLAFTHFWLERNRVTLFEGALDILQRLAKDYTLGVITNGNADIYHIGLGHLFAFAQNAATAGVAKPHPGIFHAALAKTAFRPEQAVYVGDDLTNDVFGARQAGLYAIWCKTKQQSCPPHIQPHATINGIDELEKALNSLYSPTLATEEKR